MEIKISELTLTLSKRTILDRVTAEFPCGKIYGIVGQNGSGKSMLFKCICGFVRYDGGSIAADGRVIGKDIDYLNDVGLLIERPGLFDTMSGYKNLSLLAGIKGKIGKAEIETAIKNIGLDPYDKKRVSKYSLGMKQRLGIAQAMMEEPSVLILDEPMNGLDHDGVDTVRRAILNYKRSDRTIFLASHNPDDIALLCDEVYEMEAGRMRAVQRNRGC